MSRALRFAMSLVAALALLTWGASVIVHRTTSDWFENDLRLRAQLAVTGAHQALMSQWRPESRTDLQQILSGLTHDERIMAAAACDADLGLLAETVDYPTAFGCMTVGNHVRTASGSPLSAWTPWYTVTSLEGGNVHLSAIPLIDRDQPLGFVVLAHDLSYVERRDAKMRQFLLATFGLLALATSIATILAARWSWTGWSNELRRLVQGKTDRPEFQPFVRDVREFVDRILTETERDRETGSWTPERLKHALNRYLHGEKIVILANREPYIHERAGDASIRVVHPASGLVTALEPVMRACSGVWVAHGSGTADRDTVDAHDRVAVPPGEESYFLRRLWLTPEEEKGYYYGFANEGLWPLCHLAHARPIFRREDWEHYQAVNKRFADAVCPEVDSDDPIVLVQDYHFALAPRLIRERLPRATVIMFWHIPWPNAERLGICPWRNALLDGMLGASILGFHTQSHCNNFVDSARPDSPAARWTRPAPITARIDAPGTSPESRHTRNHRGRCPADTRRCLRPRPRRRPRHA